MLNLLDRVIRVVKWFLTEKQQILIILYVCYIWDGIRKRYIEIRIEQYCKYYSNSNLSRRVGCHEDRDVDYLRYLKSSRSILIDSDETAKQYHLGTRLIDSRTKSVERNRLTGKEFTCPLPEMPNLIRIYQIVSSVFHTYSVIKYALVSSIMYRWIDLDQTCACYLPCRLGFFVEASIEMPWFAFLQCSYHVIWRLMWRYHAGRLELDCLLFLYNDEETIIEKQFELLKLNDNNIAPEIAYRKYLCNKTFFEKQVDHRGHTSYSMKHHRTIRKHRELHKTISRLFFFFWTYLFGIILPPYIYGIYTQMTAEYFRRNYPSCEFLSSHYTGTDNFQWSLSDKFRVSYLLFDMFDNLIISVDTVMTMIFPFGAGIILTQELNSRFDALCGKLCELNDRLRRLAFQQCASSSPVTMASIEHLTHESDSIIKETVSAFDHVRKVDEFVRIVATFSLFGWFVVELSLQFIIVYRRHLLDKTALAYYFYIQIAAVLTFWAFFLVMSRPYNKTRILYNKLCSSMALCPSAPRMKISWLWLLEYYHKDSGRYTLHLMGKSYVLSNMNFLRFMSWLATCIMIVLSLWSRKQSL